MAKLRTNNSVATLNTGAEVLAKKMKVSEIIVNPELESIFDKDEKIVQSIKESMEQDGFHKEEPIVLAKLSDGSVVGVADGHTRLYVAKLLGIEEVPVVYNIFENFEEIKTYTIIRQLFRRNLSQADLLKYIETLMGFESIKNKKGRISEVIADMLNISPRTVQKAISVIKDNDEEIKEKIKTGEFSINQGYTEKHPKSKDKNVATLRQSDDEDEFSSKETQDDICESLSEGNAGNPASLNFSHSDGIERPHHNPWETSEYDNRLIERYKEGKKDGFEKGFSDGAYEVWQKIMEMLKDGKTQEEIENDKLFEDFTFSVIAKKLDIEYEE